MNHIKNQQPPIKFTRFLFHFIRKYKVEFFILIFTSLTYSTCQSLFPYLIKLVINVGNPTNINLHTNNLVLLLSVIWIFLQLLINFQGIYIYKTFPPLKAIIKNSIFNYVTEFDEEFFIRLSNGSISRCINNIANSSEKIIQICLFNILAIICAFILSVIMMTYTSTIFSILLIVWFCLHTLTSYLFIKNGVKYESEYTISNQQTSSFVDNALTNLTNAKLFGMLPVEKKRHLVLNRVEVKKYKKGIMHYEKMKIIQSILVALFISGTLFFLVNFIQVGKITLGDFTMIAMLSFTLINFVSNTSSQSIHLAREIGILNSNIQLINHNDFQHQDKNKIVLNDILSIHFVDVSFFYNNKSTVIDKLSFTIRAGDKIGITGPSGQGKSTFIKLLLGIYKANSGSVLINEIHISKISRENLYSKISVIQQEPILVNCSIKDNIKYGNQEATDEEVHRVSKLACCHDFINELSDGYETQVNAQGLTLSGGQKQRIALARAILRNTPIIIMDEPTSALDSITEECIQKNIQNYLADKTVIIISHKSTFLRLVDKIYFFKEGKFWINNHDRNSKSLNVLSINQ